MSVFFASAAVPFAHHLDGIASERPGAARIHAVVLIAAANRLSNHG